ncbi:hypothetical protein GCM10010377_41130 [Streptomyces viridiviolaceus]|uniref:Secreted protein n=1 Tax=Streptomyces viridiviolaceus TaxID=68282 RepID=A0ABW2E5F8_9ACTN|nr:hypothetical protein [Streptomyces viridiviolaceus]GHB46030.1 hypothetical protein GCM10010377_41130 [Streptomyces viridiviolaceus]
MGTHPTRTAVTLCAAAALAIPLGTASAAPSAERTGHHHARDPVLVDCFWSPEVRPGAFLLACGDGNSHLVSLNWSRWGSQSAMARGVNVVNDCKPYCAVGTFRSYAVTVRLDQPRTWEKDPDRQQFTRMSLTYHDGRPEGYPRTVTYPLWS